MRFRRGMTVLERQRYREELLRREIEKAYRQVSIYHRSQTCRDGMQAYGDLARRLHGNCRGEEFGNSGCLCECHDNHRSGVEPGTAIEMSSDDPEPS